MSRRQSDAARIVTYFRTAELGAAKVVFDLVKDEMKARLKTGEAGKAKGKKKAEGSVETWGTA